MPTLIDGQNHSAISTVAATESSITRPSIDRVEAYHHYPSDTLAGAALGNFLANFIFDAFLKPANSNKEQGAKADVSLDLADDGTWLKFTWGF